jgi:hypothetical protein
MNTCKQGVFMKILNATVSLDELELLLPCLGEEGQDVYPSPEVIALALGVLQAPDDALLRWHLPDVFSVRYGSSYAGAVRWGNLELRLHGDYGDFREEDVKWDKVEM